MKTQKSSNSRRNIPGSARLDLEHSDGARAAAATVKLTGKGGYGVLISNLILTAAHCISYSIEGGMVLGDYYIEEIRTAQGLIKARPVAVEPVSDIAVLGPLDDQEFGEEAEAFLEFCSTTQPVTLGKDEFPLRRPQRVKIHGHDGTWIEGKATRFNDHLASVCVEAESEVKCGSSGGPILNTKGELIAIVSHFSSPNQHLKSTGSAPRPLYALPVWVCRKLRSLKAPRAKLTSLGKGSL